MSAEILVAVVAAVPASIAAFAALSAKKEVKSPNGTKTGALVALTYETLTEHINDEEIHCNGDSSNS